MSNWPIHKDSWKSSSSEFNTLIGIWAETLVRKMWDARDCSFGGEHDDKPSNLRLPYVDTKPQKRIAGITRCSSQSQGGPGCPTSTSLTYRKDPPILSRYMCMYISYYHIISYVIYHMPTIHLGLVKSPALPPLWPFQLEAPQRTALASPNQAVARPRCRRTAAAAWAARRSTQSLHLAMLAMLAMASNWCWGTRGL